MSDSHKLKIHCPECNTYLTVDAATGEILMAKKPERPLAGGHDFDALLTGLDEQKNQAEEVFQREVDAMKDRDRLLEEKFKEALKRAEEEPDDEPPLRPFDLD